MAVASGRPPAWPVQLLLCSAVAFGVAWVLVLVDALGHRVFEDDDVHPRHVVLVAAVSAAVLLTTAVAALVRRRRSLDLLAALGLVLGSLGWGLAEASAPYRVVGVVLGALLTCASFVASARTVRRPRRLVSLLAALLLVLVLVVAGGTAWDGWRHYAGLMVHQEEEESGLAVLLPSVLAAGAALGLLVELVWSRLGASDRALSRT